MTGPLTSDPIYGFPADYGLVQSVTGTFSIVRNGATTVTGTFTGVSPPAGSIGNNIGSCYAVGPGDFFGYTGVASGDDRGRCERRLRRDHRRRDRRREDAFPTAADVRDARRVETVWLWQLHVQLLYAIVHTPVRPHGCVYGSRQWLGDK